MTTPHPAQAELDILRRQLSRIGDLSDLLRRRRDPLAGRTLADLIDRWLVEAITDPVPVPVPTEISMLRLATEIVSDGHRLADRMAKDDAAETYANDLRGVLFPWHAVADRQT